MSPLGPSRMSRATSLALGLGLISTGAVGNAHAEPTFLSKQYTRCTACHYSDTGGGLLTPYGRSLSREAISMLGARGTEDDAANEGAAGEEAFLGGLLDGVLSPLALGLSLRPSHLRFATSGHSIPDRNFFMNLDLLAAYQTDRWTLYGEVGRQPTPDGGILDSYEHWVSYRIRDGLRVRAGRFLPAYGIRLADHTAFSRQFLGLAQYDQLYGVELSVSTERTLLQVAASPGPADAIVDDDGGQAFTTAGRVQVDLNSRSVLAGSVLYRHATGRSPWSTDAGLAVGFAPTPRVTTWTQVDLRTRTASNHAYIVTHQTSVETLRGVWIRVSPQVYWTDHNPLLEKRRLVLGVDFFPRTHWHLNLSYYRDRNPVSDRSSRTFLAQLHVYL